jgi:hypothetical protein
LNAELVRLWSHNREEKLRKICPTKFSWEERMETRVYNGSIIPYRLPFFYWPWEHMRVYWLVFPCFLWLSDTNSGATKGNKSKTRWKPFRGQLPESCSANTQSSHNHWRKHFIESKNMMTLACNSIFSVIRRTF